MLYIIKACSAVIPILSYYQASYFSSLEGFRNISNEYSITTRMDREHPKLREYAQSKGWWDGVSEFNFAKAYSYMTTARIEASDSRYCEGKKMMEKSNGEFMYNMPNKKKNIVLYTNAS